MVASRFVAVIPSFTWRELTFAVPCGSGKANVLIIFHVFMSRELNEI